MPILHLSQLIGVAAGLEESELKFQRHVVSVEPVLEKLRFDRGRKFLGRAASGFAGPGPRRGHARRRSPRRNRLPEP